MVEKNVNDSSVSSGLEFILHVIPPPMRLNWKSPRGLLLTTFLTHLRKDLAPIGHFFVEFPVLSGSASKFHPKVAPLIEGGKSVITGMSRRKMTFIKSFKTVQGKRLGLGSLYYDFDGKLDSVEEARKEILWAKKKKRYASIRISISEKAAEEMMDFLAEWIERGSFHHYSGGLKVDCGEGAGCAEFAMYFLCMALGVHAVNPDWMRRVRIPHTLIGGGLAGLNNQVTLVDLLKHGHRWAHGNEPHHVYSIPDPELVFDWIKDHRRVKQSDSGSTVEWNTFLIPGEINWATSSFSRKEFTVDYTSESLGSIQEQWSRVVEK
jgi:hypothetical protein